MNEIDKKFGIKGKLIKCFLILVIKTIIGIELFFAKHF